MAKSGWAPARTAAESAEPRAQAGDVGVDLYEERILFGDAAGADDAVDGDAVVAETFDDGAGAEGGGFDEGAVEFGLCRVERGAEGEAGEERIDEDGAVAVVPVEREQAGLAGLQFGGFCGEDGVEFGVAEHAFYEPLEDVADGGLAGFESVVAGEDGAFDDAADAGDVGDGFVGGDHAAIAGGGSDDFDERALGDAGTDGAVVDVHLADGDGDAGGESEFFGPFGAEGAGGDGGVVGF